MKSLIRVILILAVLVLAGFAALQFWLGPKLEEQARLELAALPEALAFSELLRFEPLKVKSVEFSAFSRRLILRGLELRGTMDLTAFEAGVEQQPRSAALNYTLEEASYRLPWRALLLFTPLRDMILPETGMMAVGEEMRISNFVYSLNQGTVSARSVVRDQEAVDIRMESGLIRELLEQRKPSNMLNALYRIGIGEMRASAMTSEMTIPEQGIKMDCSCDAMRIRNWEGRTIEEAVADGIVLKEKDRELMRLGNITEKRFTLPEEAAMQELLTLLSQTKPDENALQALLLRIVTTGEPLLREISFSDLHFPLDGQALTFKKMALNWQSNTPLLERESDLAFPGLPALVLDAKLGFTSEGDGGRHKGLLSAQHLGSLDYDFIMSAGSPLAGSQALFLSSYKDVNLKYTDQGLTAYLVRNVIPSAQGATPALKAAIAELCPGDTPENAAVRDALETFVSRPGVLEVQSRPGKTFRVFELLAKLGGKDPGALLSVTAQPGKESLEQQISGLDATAAKAK